MIVVQIAIVSVGTDYKSYKTYLDISQIEAGLVEMNNSTVPA